MKVIVIFRRLQKYFPAWLLVCSAVLLAGCSTPPQPHPTEDEYGLVWSGRMALQISDPLSAEKTFSAAFHLQGNPVTGSLDIFSPLGSQIAQLQWQPGTALLIQGSQHTYSESLPSLLHQVLGTELPIQALFSWLKGDPANAVGWQVDLSRRAQGRITAYRMTPAPQATLRLVLQQPE